MLQRGCESCTFQRKETVEGGKFELLGMKPKIMNAIDRPFLLLINKTPHTALRITMTQSIFD